MYEVSPSTVFIFVSYIHIHCICTCPLYNILLEVVGCCFPRNDILLNMMLFVRSQSYISPQNFMFVSTVVSEIRELNQNKRKEKNSEIGYFQFNTFPGHIIYLFFKQRYTCTMEFVRSPVHHKLKVIIKDFHTIMLAKPGPSLYTQYYCTVWPIRPSLYT